MTEAPFTTRRRLHQSVLLYHTFHALGILILLFSCAQNGPRPEASGKNQNLLILLIRYHPGGFVLQNKSVRVGRLQEYPMQNSLDQFRTGALLPFEFNAYSSGSDAVYQNQFWIPIPGGMKLSDESEPHRLELEDIENDMPSLSLFLPARAGIVYIEFFQILPNQSDSLINWERVPFGMLGI